MKQMILFIELAANFGASFLETIYYESDRVSVWNVPLVSLLYYLLIPQSQCTWNVVNYNLTRSCLPIFNTNKNMDPMYKKETRNVSLINLWLTLKMMIENLGE